MCFLYFLVPFLWGDFPSSAFFSTDIFFRVVFDGFFLEEDVLSFLGLLNIDMSWGIMIYLSQTDGFIFSGMRYWWLILPAGLAVTFLAGGFYLVGRGLDDVFNPRLRKR